MNLSVVPSAWRPPVLPDLYACDEFYSSDSKPHVLDCDVALGNIPLGSANITWSVNNPQAPYGLPYIARYETCEIQFQASGAAAHNLQTIDFSFDKIRNMAGWVIDQCVYGDKSGGFVTAEIANTLNYVTLPDVFHEDPFPTDTTFLSLQVQESESIVPEFNAGDMDPMAGDCIIYALRQAWQNEPSYSTLKQNLKRNYDFYFDAVVAMLYYTGRTWWEPPAPSLANSSATNLTNPLGNSTLKALNSTSLCGKSGQKFGTECGGLANDLVSTS